LIIGETEVGKVHRFGLFARIAAAAEHHLNGVSTAAVRAGSDSTTPGNTSFALTACTGAGMTHPQKAHSQTVNPSILPIEGDNCSRSYASSIILSRGIGYGHMDLQ
jgi:hypothetical protein